MAAGAGNGESGASHAKGSPDQLQVLDIFPDDFGDMGVGNLTDLLQADESVNYSKLLHDSLPLSPVPTVVADIPKNGDPRNVLPKRGFGPVARTVAQGLEHSRLIPSTVQELADAPEPLRVVQTPSTSTVRAITRATTQNRKKTQAEQSVCRAGRTDTKPPTRKRPDRRPKQLTLPEFLINTLRNKKYCPSVLRWEDEAKGIFKIMQGKQLAQLWRTCRQKTGSLKYEFFARAMRYYYKRDFIKRVEGRKMLYQFQDKCNWRRTLDKSQTHGHVHGEQQPGASKTVHSGGIKTPLKKHEHTSKECSPNKNGSASSHNKKTDKSQSSHT